MAQSAHRVSPPRPVVVTTAHLATRGQRREGATLSERLQELVPDSPPLAHVRDVKHGAVG